MVPPCEVVWTPECDACAPPVMAMDLAAFEGILGILPGSLTASLFTPEKLSHKGKESGKERIIFQASFFWGAKMLNFGGVSID